MVKWQCPYCGKSMYSAWDKRTDEAVVYIHCDGTFESHNELYLVDKHGEVELPDTHSIKQAKMDGEDYLNDFIAIIESRMEEELSQTQGVQSKDCVRHTYQHYINKAVALRNEWLEQCDLDLEVLLNG